MEFCISTEKSDNGGTKFYFDNAFIDSLQADPVYVIMWAVQIFRCYLSRLPLSIREKREAQLLEIFNSAFTGGGESGADVDLRVSSFLNTLFRDFESDKYPDNTLIFSHGAWIKIFLRRFFHLPFEFIQEVKTLPNCGFYHLALKDGKYVFPNDICHNPDASIVPFKYAPII